MFRFCVPSYLHGVLTVSVSVSVVARSLCGPRSGGWRAQSILNKIKQLDRLRKCACRKKQAATSNRTTLLSYVTSLPRHEDTCTKKKHPTTTTQTYITHTHDKQHVQMHLSRRSDTTRAHETAFACCRTRKSHSRIHVALSQESAQCP